MSLDLSYKILIKVISSLLRVTVRWLRQWVEKKCSFYMDIVVLIRACMISIPLCMLSFLEAEKGVIKNGAPWILDALV